MIIRHDNGTGTFRWVSAKGYVFLHKRIDLDFIGCSLYIRYEADYIPSDQTDALDFCVAKPSLVPHYLTGVS